MQAETNLNATAPNGQESPPQWQDPAAKFTNVQNLTDGLEMTLWAAQRDDAGNIRLGIRLMLCALTIHEVSLLLQAAIDDLAGRVNYAK